MYRTPCSVCVARSCPVLLGTMRHTLLGDAEKSTGQATSGWSARSDPVPYLPKQGHFLAGPDFLLPSHPVVGLDHEEQDEGDDEEVDHRRQESPDTDVGDHPFGKVLEGEDLGNKRVDDVLGETGDDSGEGEANHEGNGDVDQVPSIDEILELPDHDA